MSAAQDKNRSDFIERMKERREERKEGRAEKREGRREERKEKLHDVAIAAKEKVMAWKKGQSKGGK